MRLPRWIGMCALLVLIAAAAMLLLRNPSSESGTVAVDSTPARAAVPAPASSPGFDPAPAEAGMMAYIDPETGDLTTGPAPAGESGLDPDLQNALRHDDAGLKVVTRADGSKVMDLQGRYQHVAIIRIDEDGTKTTMCTDDETAAEHNLHHAPVANPNAPEVK